MSGRVRHDGDGGFMLVELLVVVTLMAIVGGLLSDAIVSAMRGQRDITARATDLDSLRQAMERTTRDMRAAQQVDIASPQLVKLELPGSGVTRVIVWSVSTANGSSSLVESESDTTPAGVTTVVPPVTVLGNLDPSTPLFGFSSKAGYQPTTPGSVDQFCQVVASPGSYEQRCVGAIGIDLKALLPGHPDLELADTVQLRNVV